MNLKELNDRRRFHVNVLIILHPDTMATSDMEFYKLFREESGNHEPYYVMIDGPNEAVLTLEEWVTNKRPDLLRMYQQWGLQRLAIGVTKEINIGAVPYQLSRPDKESLVFSDRSGFAGYYNRFMYTKKADGSNLMQLVFTDSTFGSVPVCHLVRAFEIAQGILGRDHAPIPD